MSIGQIIVSAAIVGAFVLFAAVLGWVDYRAWQLAPRIRDQERKEAVPTASVMALKKDDKSAAAASGTARARGSQPSDDRLQHVA
jgi:hypothetical protein